MNMIVTCLSVFFLITIAPSLALANSGSFASTTSATSFVPTGSTVPSDGLYLPGANVSGIADNSNPVAKFSGVSSGVDYWQFTNSATANPATETLQATGSDTNITAEIQGKGTGGVALMGTSTNDNACAGCVGEYIYADGGGSGSGTVTITIASPAVITWTGHKFSVNDGTIPVSFTTTGSLPTGITANTTYWVIPSSVTANTFEIASSIANAFAGTAINTTGSQSGTQTATPGVSLTGSFQNVAAISLPAGDYDACGTVMFIPTNGTVTAGAAAQIGSASATNQGFPNSGMSTYWPYSWTTSSGLLQIMPTGCGRIVLSSTTTYYLIGQANISGGSASLYGFLGARRRR